MSIFGRLFRARSRNSPYGSAANDEIAQVERRLNDVYNRNNSYFYNEVPGAVSLAMQLVVAPKQRDIPGLFALGVIMETIEKRPALPTPPYDRAFVHLMKFFASGDTPFPEAQTRMVNVKEQLESLDKLASYIVSQGREAADEYSEPTYLAKCYAAAERHNVLNENY